MSTHYLDAIHDAWVKFSKSDAGKKLSDASTLGSPPRANEYLANRMQDVFHCGAEAAKQALADVAADKAREEIRKL